MKEIFILGVGHNTIVTIDLAEACGYKVVGLYHYNNDLVGAEYFGHKVVGCSKELFCKDLTGLQFAISVGDNKIRTDIYNIIKSCGGEIPNLCHPQAVISKYAKIGDGNLVYAFSVISADVKIGNNCVISYQDLIAHGVTIKSNCFVASNVVVGAYTNIEESVFIGSGSTIISGKVNSIGENAFIGAGSIVTKSVKANSIVKGNPAN